MRDLFPAEPNLFLAKSMVLEEDDGTRIVEYTCERSWRRIQRYGRWFRLAGSDPETFELIYWPEKVPAESD